MIELSKFLEVAKKNAHICKSKQIRYPCSDGCNKLIWEDPNDIKMHLIKRGFVKGYTTWSHHGEAVSTFNNADIDTEYDEVGDEDADGNDHVMTDYA